MATVTTGKLTVNQKPAAAVAENGRTGLTSEALKLGFLDHLYFTLGKYSAVANDHDLYMALSYTVRDRMMERWINAVQNYRHKDKRVVCYLSAEFLPGKHQANSVAELVNNDPAIRGKLKAVFLPDYNVSLGERIYPNRFQQPGKKLPEQDV